MFHALVIMLQQPFIADGRLGSSTSSSAAAAAFQVCATAAADIDEIVRWYKAHYCIKSPPYFLSYATYVSATIHVRSVAQHQQQRPRQHSPRHDARRHLQECLDVLAEHQSECHAPRRALDFLLGLMGRLGVDMGVSLAMPTSDRNCCRSIIVDRNQVMAPNVPLGAEPPSLPAMDTAKPMVGQTSQQGLPNTPGDFVGASPGTIDQEQDMERNGQSGDVGPIAEEFLPNALFDFDPLFGFDDPQIDWSFV